LGGALVAQGNCVGITQPGAYGRGEWVQSLVAGGSNLNAGLQGARYLMKGEVAGQEGNFHPTSPGTGMFQTADGYINIAASGDNLWRRFCEAADAKYLLENPDFATVAARAKNRQALIAHLNEIMRLH